MKTIPCDYSQYNSRQCEDGKVLIYGEMGGPPPEIITCPKCNGTGTLQFLNHLFFKKLPNLPKSGMQLMKKSKSGRRIWHEPNLAYRSRCISKRM